MAWLVENDIEYKLRLSFDRIYPWEPTEGEIGPQHEYLLDEAEAAVKAALDAAGFEGKYDLAIEQSRVTAWHETEPKDSDD